MGTSALDPLRPVAEARHRTRVWLQQHWKLGELADSVELAVGELCTNAVRHGGGLAGLGLTLGVGRQFAPPFLRVMVTDQAPALVPGLPARADLLDEGGRALRLVEALARRWGWRRTGFDEKQVWCTFGLGADPEPPLRDRRIRTLLLTGPAEGRSRPCRYGAWSTGRGPRTGSTKTDARTMRPPSKAVGKSSTWKPP